MTSVLGATVLTLGREVPGLILESRYLSHEGLLVLACIFLLVALAYTGIRSARRSRRAKAEEQEREDRYRGLIEETSDIIHIVSPDGKFLYVNKAWRRTFGYSDDEIASMSQMDLLHPDEREKATREIRQVMEGQSVSDIETRFVTKNGRTIWVEGNSTRELQNGEVVSRRGIFHDVTERRRAEAERSRLLAILEEAPDFINTFAPDGKVLWLNRAFRKLRDVDEKSDLSELKIAELHPLWANQILAQALPTVLSTGIWKGESAVLDPQGKEVPVSHTIVAHRDESGNISYLSTLCRDITASRQAEEALREAHAQLNEVLQREKELARTDVLTGLANRRAFYEALQVERSRAARYRRPITLACVDLDNFKRVNDTLGHSVGDELLARVADVLRQTLRLTDTIGRLGGDEFALLLPETDAPSAEALLEKLRVVLRRAMEARKWPVTFSVGAATFLENPPSIEHMIQTADELMYAVKKSGKNRISVVLIGGTAVETV